MAHYYNIDDIIMEEEIISVVFQVAANGVGLLDPSAETNSVEQGSKVELPFWLAQELHLRQAVAMNVLACFNQKTRKEIQVNAACVDLRNRCPYFYELGCKIAPLYKEVLSKAHSAAFAVAPKFLTLLTKEETHLYEAARSSMAAFKKWRTGGPRFERASILGIKRKPAN
ncbi:DNA replication complex GINS protein PSF3-like [Telopea speciosissima]|uniref:DNA replication complex GINS protein PSF3-like n=1 Tax=Telopea speciosissima TaxID=54955 RepID=UPI001CC3F9FF|nr:DNA replication complex GINS protein PSF3-like [Telopea speciosissima]